MVRCEGTILQGCTQLSPGVRLTVSGKTLLIQGRDLTLTGIETSCNERSRVLSGKAKLTPHNWVIDDLASRDDFLTRFGILTEMPLLQC